MLRHITEATCTNEVNFFQPNNRCNGVFELQRNNGMGNNGVMAHLEGKK